MKQIRKTIIVDLEKKQRRKNKLSERQRGQKKRDLGAWTLAAGRGIE